MLKIFWWRQAAALVDLRRQVGVDGREIVMASLLSLTNLADDGGNHGLLKPNERRRVDKATSKESATQTGRATRAWNQL